MDNTLSIEFLYKVKNNKKYKSISDNIVLNEIENYLKKNPKVNHPNKESIKEIRKELHRLYSSYQTRKKNKIDKYLNELENLNNNKEILHLTETLLSITLSTKERLDDYQEIYKKIFDETLYPKKIIDLGCGYNPFSYPLMNLEGISYYAYDIDERDVLYLNKYFSIMEKHGLKGKASIIDVRNPDEIKKLPATDIIFMFKLIDLIDKKHKITSEKLLMDLINKTKFIVVSFATKTLTGKKMNLPKRTGFELMLNRNNLDFKKFDITNEMFYIIHKKI